MVLSTDGVGHCVVPPTRVKRPLKTGVPKAPAAMSAASTGRTGSGRRTEMADVSYLIGVETYIVMITG